jgi:hypothetical protein
MKMKVRKLQSNDILQDVFDKNVQEGEGGIPENLKSTKTLKKTLQFFFLITNQMHQLFKFILL